MQKCEGEVTKLRLVTSRLRPALWLRTTWPLSAVVAVASSDASLPCPAAPASGLCVAGCAEAASCNVTSQGLYAEVRYFQLGRLQVPASLQAKYLRALILDEENSREKLVQQAQLIREDTRVKVSNDVARTKVVGVIISFRILSRCIWGQRVWRVVCTQLGPASALVECLSRPCPPWFCPSIHRCFGQSLFFVPRHSSSHIVLVSFITWTPKWSRSDNERHLRTLADISSLILNFKCRYNKSSDEFRTLAKLGANCKTWGHRDISHNCRVYGIGAYSWKYCSAPLTLKPNLNRMTESGDCCTNGRIGPTWDNPRLRHVYWLLNRLTAIMTNQHDVIWDCPT